MKNLIVGGGEIGRALLTVLNDSSTRIIAHRGEESDTDCDIFHVCFPYGEEFHDAVVGYQQRYHAKYTVIHSTVPVGTSRTLDAIHSPVIGRHPHLAESIRTFTKFLGGELASAVADVFRRAGVKVYLFDQQETTELMKLLDTAYFGVCVEYTKDVKRQCQRYGVPFEAFSLWTDAYNNGYQQLGCPEYTRPNLVPIMQKIGGHCVLPNATLIETPFTKLLREL